MVPEEDQLEPEIAETPQVAGDEEVGQHNGPEEDDFSFIRRVLIEDGLFCPLCGARFAKKTNTKCHLIRIHDVPASSLDLLGGRKFFELAHAKRK